MARIKVRKGMPSVAISKAEFTRRARERFVDPVFEPLQAEIDNIIEAAWNGYHAYRKAPRSGRRGHSSRALRALTPPTRMTGHRPTSWGGMKWLNLLRIGASWPSNWGPRNAEETP